MNTDQLVVRSKQLNVGCKRKSDAVFQYVTYLELIK